MNAEDLDQPLDVSTCELCDADWRACRCTPVPTTDRDRELARALRAGGPELQQLSSSELPARAVEREQ